MVVRSVDPRGIKIDGSRMMIDFLGNMKRTNYCGDLRKEDANREVTLLGWVQRRRDLGGLIFVELRDRQGIVQVVFNSEVSPEAHEKAQSLLKSFWTVLI